MNTITLAHAEDPTLPFHDVWWISLIKLLGIFVILLLFTLFTINYERKVVARMAVRPGPNQVGPKGWLQSLTDGVKLPFKEEIIPKTAANSRAARPETSPASVPAAWPTIATYTRS